MKGKIGMKILVGAAALFVLLCGFFGVGFIVGTILNLFIPSLGLINPPSKALGGAFLTVIITSVLHFCYEIGDDLLIGR